MGTVHINYVKNTSNINLRNIIFQNKVIKLKKNKIN